MKNQLIADEDYESSIKFAEKYLPEIVNELQKSQIQIFKQGLKGRKVPNGSGVLLKIEEMYFMISAAHVTDENTWFVFYNKKEIKKLRGTLKSTPVPTGKIRKDDSIDVSILKIHPDDAAELKDFYSFIEPSQITPEHTIDQVGLKYVIVGKPSSVIKVSRDSKKVDVNGFGYLACPCKQEIYERLGKSEQDSILLEYPSKLTDIMDDSKKERSPDPSGISGSGLWYLHFDENNEENPSTVSISLVGIMIEFQKKKYRCMVATRINHIIEFLREFIDEG